VLLSVAAALLLLLLPFAAAQVRVDPRAIAKYRDDPVVMQAFSKLLEIENILERL
jgi:hypothetical protein